jgi:hypothetical protein
MNLEFSYFAILNYKIEYYFGVSFSIIDPPRRLLTPLKMNHHEEILEQ